MSNRVLLLLRGLPGSGKSTLASVLAGGKAPIFSIDDYFTDPTTGVYEFRFAENHLAYKQCQANTRAAMEKGSELIILHNTFTLEWEMEPYFQMSSEFGYQVHVVTVENRHGSSNVHGVTNEQLLKMASGYHVELLGTVIDEEE